MNVKKTALIIGLSLMAGCSSTQMSERGTLNEPSMRMAATEDRLPPNPNRPNDARDQKAIPPVVQSDPVPNGPKPDSREDKGLAVNAGQDQLVRPQDPTQTDEAPGSVGGPAVAQQESVSKIDSELAQRVKEALIQIQNHDANVDPQLTSDPTNGEAKAVQQNFEVTAKNGRVTLSGSVASESERAAFEEATMRLPGVSSVSNYLSVSKPDKQ